MKLEHTLTPCTKINSKQLTDLNIRYDTIKLLAEIKGKYSEINHNNVCLGPSLKATEIKTKKMWLKLIPSFKLIPAFA